MNINNNNEIQGRGASAFAEYFAKINTLQEFNMGGISADYEGI